MQRGFLWMIIALAVGACTTKPKLPDLGQIYQATSKAQGESLDRRPLVTVPGTLGSRLVDSRSGRVIWGGSGSRGISADPEDPEEYQLIALPIGKANEPLGELTDTVVPAGILETAEAEVLGIPIDINVYGEALGVLREGGFSVDLRPSGRDAREVGFEPDDTVSQSASPAPAVLPGDFAAARENRENEEATNFDSFQFDYDWRRDIIESAHKFGDFIERRRAEVARWRGVPPSMVRFDLLAHSMGTLVTRYFLMYGKAEPRSDGSLPPITWAGAKYFSRVVFVAPPNAGSVIAMDNLINGKEIGPLQPVYPAAMLGTHHSTYQLMPRDRHRRVTSTGEPIDSIYDPELWQTLRWGLANPAADVEFQKLMPDEPDRQTRLARAMAHQARLLKRAEQFHTMMDRWTPPPPHLDLFLVVGGGFETPASAEVDPLTGEFRITASDEGDGVVLRASALLDERMDGDFTRGFRSPLRFKTTLFLPDEHVDLTKNRVFGDNLLFWLLEAPRGGNRLARPEHAGFLGSVADGSSEPVPQSRPAAQPPAEVDR